MWTSGGAAECGSDIFDLSLICLFRTCGRFCKHDEEEESTQVSRRFARLLHCQSGGPWSNRTVVDGRVSFLSLWRKHKSSLGPTTKVLSQPRRNIVGCRIQHVWKDGAGHVVWKGTVLDQVRSQTWFNRSGAALRSGSSWESSLRAPPVLSDAFKNHHFLCECHQVPVNPSLYLIKYDGFDCVYGLELHKDERVQGLEVLPDRLGKTGLRPGSKLMSPGTNLCKSSGFRILKYSLCNILRCYFPFMTSWQVKIHIYIWRDLNYRVWFSIFHRREELCTIR